MSFENANKLMIDRLRGEMDRLGMNARELSEIADVGRSFVYDILSGKSSNPTTQKMAAIADALGVSVPYLISGLSNDNEISEKLGGKFVAIQVACIEVGKEGKHSVEGAINKPPHFFHKSWIEGSLNTKPQNLRILTVSDDCMSPALIKEDIILIDISKKVPNPPGMFALFDGQGFVLKRLEYVRKLNSSSIIVKSDNQTYTPYETTLDEIDIIGKVVWFSRKI